MEMEKDKIPKMKAIIIEEWKSLPKIQSVPIPKPSSGEVLIKVYRAPINPADLSFLKGKYPTNKNPPISPGIEGCGVVVESGGGILGWTLIGKKVSFLASENHSGSWAEFCVTEAKKCVILDDKIPYEVGACGLANPITVLCFYEKLNSIIQTASCSAIGRMILRYFTANRINVINIVRKKEQEITLKEEENAQYVVNSESENFEKDLIGLCERLQPKVCFDAVAGDLIGKVLKFLFINIYVKDHA